jgi:probable F420-dependent oxidoreductase
MRVGFALPQYGPVAGPDAALAVAKRAEELAYDTLWVLDRLLVPVEPRAPYPAGDGTVPEVYRRALDPIGTLTFAAAVTRTIGLGTSILNAPWYSPALLGRQLTTLDVLSGGRLRVGLGTGWSPDEYEAAGAPWKERGRRADEFVRALKTIWTTDPVEFRGTYYRIPKSYIGPKPVQKPYPPIYMAAYAPASMQRVAREASGWFPVGVPIAAMGQMLEGIRGLAREAGRDPASVELIVRANVEFVAGGQRADYTGTLDQIGADIAATRALGASEILLDIFFSPDVTTLDAVLKRMEQLREIAR